MGIFRETIKGAGWVGGLRLLSRLLTLIKTAILARLLVPAQFGIFGVVALTLSFFEIMTETGINAVLIQEDEDIAPFINTAWVISIFRGILISLLIFLASFPVARFFSSPAALKFLLLTSLVPLVRGLINPAIVQFRKKLQFKKEFNLRLVILLTEAIVAIGLALLTRSVISLILALIFSALIEVVLSFIFCSPRPRFAWEKEKAKHIITYGKWITFSGIFSYLVDQGDDAVVGKLLGMGSLGLYQMAYKVSNLPFTEITSVFSWVAFPVYAQVAEKKERIKKAFQKTLLTTTLFALPAAALIFFFPEIIIKIILGPNWLEASSALRVLAIFGLTRAISGSAQPILYAFRRQDLAAKINLAKLVSLSVLIFPLTLNWEIQGAALAVLISSFLIQPLIWKSVKEVLE